MRIMIVIVGILAIVLCNFQPTVVTTINWIFTWGVPLFVMLVIGLCWKRNTTAAMITMFVSWIANIVWVICGLQERLGMDNFPSGISVHDCFSNPWPCSDSRAAWNKTWIFPLIQRRKSGLLGKGGKDKW